MQGAVDRFTRRSDDDENVDLDSGIAQVLEDPTVVPGMIPGLRFLPQRCRIKRLQPQLHGATAGLEKCLAHVRLEQLIAGRQIALPGGGVPDTCQLAPDLQLPSNGQVLVDEVDAGDSQRGDVFGDTAFRHYPGLVKKGVATGRDGAESAPHRAVGHRVERGHEIRAPLADSHVEHRSGKVLVIGRCRDSGIDAHPVAVTPYDSRYSGRIGTFGQIDHGLETLGVNNGVPMVEQGGEFWVAVSV